MALGNYLVWIIQVLALTEAVPQGKAPSKAPADPARAAGAASLAKMTWAPPASMTTALNEVWSRQMKKSSLKFKNYGFNQVIANDCKPHCPLSSTPYLTSSHRQNQHVRSLGFRQDGKCLYPSWG
jgi:hypothetical protein